MKDSHNVVIKTICDADERLFPSRSKIVMDKTGVKPLTEWDMRKVFDDKDITCGINRYAESLACTGYHLGLSGR